MLWVLCQDFWGYLCGFCVFLWGDCGDFVTLGIDKVLPLCYAR